MLPPAATTDYNGTTTTYTDADNWPYTING
jgi:hypothetical protein